ncbi:MAG: heparan-alpha-glucosaminide N-acetyltransferase domain-containing protein [Spirochaetota bacterium]
MFILCQLQAITSLYYANTMSSSRAHHIDYLKAWAVIVMIEVHVVNCFLNPSLQTTWWFDILNFINGLVAPVFIFTAGFSFVLSVMKKREELINFSDLFLRRAGRILLIFLVGYLIHVPYFSLKNIVIYASQSELKSFYLTDVLQCIGSGLLVLLLLRMAIKSNTLYHSIITAIGLLVVFITPFVWRIDFYQWFPLPIATYCNEIHGSLFPVFPWHGFLYLGASYSIVQINNTNNNHAAMSSNLLMAISSIISIFGIVIMHFLSKNPAYTIKTSAIFFFTRYALVIVLLHVSQWYLQEKNNQCGLFIDIGKESLLVYWLHLQILYRHIFNGKSLERIVAHKFNLVECLTAFLLLAALMFAVAIMWNKLKQHYPAVSRKIFTGTILIGWIKFLFF